MKVEAYICDYCGQLKEADECMGVSPQPDIFDDLAGYPTINNPAKAFIHYCTSCYGRHAADPADREVSRRKDEAAYKLKLKELSYMIRAQAVANYNKKVAQKLARNKK